jgi:hypothetical protein
MTTKKLERQEEAMNHGMQKVSRSKKGKEMYSSFRPQKDPTLLTL